MPRPPDSGHLHLADVFHHVQRKLLADLDSTGIFEHPSAHGTATEQIWLEIFSQFLPARFRAAPAFIINSSGSRSRQIDIAIFDAHHATPLFPHPAGIHLPIESIYAVFEVKPTISKQWLTDAAEKAASVRALSPSRRPILAGLLATTSVWKPSAFPTNLSRALPTLPTKINYGCALAHGSFEHHRSLTISPPNRALIFFLLRLISRLNALRPTPQPNLIEYLNRAR